MTLKMILAGILALAVLVAWARLVLWRRAPVWRLGALLALQPICAALLFFCLYPPGKPVPSGTLVIATAGAPRNAAAEAGGRLVVLPEGPAIADAERAPDFGTALRRYPDVQRITVLGDGLTERDRDAARGMALAFTPSPTRAGIVSFDPPARTAPGARFEVAGQLAGLPEAVVELMDPAERVTDKQKADAQGRFILSGTARAAGPVTFALRVRDARGRVVEQADVPVLVDKGAAPRLLIMAGAPGPEVKYLRRWATDAGFAVTTQISAGGGIQVGDPVVAINGASLRRFDVAIIDDRSWAALGGQRSAVTEAVQDGLGLVLRTSGGAPDGAAREQWRSLGFATAGGDTLAPIVLPAAPDADIARTRTGIGSEDTPTDFQLGDEVLPEISRLGLTPGGDATVPLVRDAGGAVLSAWRASGRGRIAVFTGIDSYGLTLTGRRDLYGEWWSAMLSAVARPAAGLEPAFTGTAWAGERIALCGVSGEARVERPDGTMTTLIPDPGARGCAAFWPSTPGWHVLRDSGADASGQARPFFVQPADQLPGVRAARDRQATLMLVRDRPDAGASSMTTDRPGVAWPWFVAWLAASTLLWWFERSKLGQSVRAV